MMDFVKLHWAAHPWLTGVELATAAVVGIELLLLVHVLLGAIFGESTRFVFMTGPDAQFGAGLLAVLALAPLCVLLLLWAGIGAALAWRSGAPIQPFVEAALGGAGLLIVSGGLVLTGGLLGGVLPH